MVSESSPGSGRRALVRRPSPRLADGLVTHIARVPVDVDVAREQWHGYVSALGAAGWEAIEVAPAEGCPDSVFVEDTAVMVGTVAVLTRPGADSRKPETDGTDKTLRDLGYEVLTMERGTLDGGDVLKLGDVVYVGRGGRTDAAGLAEFRRLVTPRGFTVIGVPMHRALHLKTAVTALPDSTIIGFPPLMDDPIFFPHFRAVPEETGTAIVDLGDDRLLISASAPRTAEMLADLGYEPVPVAIGEFEKLEGCVTCLSIRLRNPPA